MPESRLNRLGNEKSPYLLEHATNPVDWYPWGEEAFKRARNDGKPILLSIGYSTCHWCHVLRRESFEDDKTAALMNRNFISIKVDREERPEVDSYYMSAVQGMTGQGGWPLTVFLTPDLKAFYGGTYFPPEPRYGMPSFGQVLEFVAKLWKEKRDEVTKDAETVFKQLQESQRLEGGGQPSASLLDDAFASLAASFDAEYGGFGGAPKFPMPLSHEFLLRYHFRTGKELALRIVTKSLHAMAAGGIRDHLGGGFHRYSTDRQWLVPHFEKMLYDNALLADLYLHAFQAAAVPALLETAKDALGWMLGELESKHGGFYSAQDADTEAGEGVYYTWTPGELAEVLGEEEAERFCRTYGVTKTGNFEGGRSILHLARFAEGAQSDRRSDAVSEARKRLYEARLKRQRPATDEKILTSWNGLAISAFAHAYRSLGTAEYGKAAERAAAFVLSKSNKDGTLTRRSVGGQAGIPGVLEDYSYFGLGLVDLFEATSQPRWLEDSLRLAEKMLTLFEDRENGGFFNSEEKPLVRLVETYDGPAPSGNSSAVMLLLRLSTITGDERFRRSADRALRRFQPLMDKEPSGHSHMLLSVDSAVNGTRELVVSATTPAKATPFVEVFRNRFLPDLTSFVLTEENGPLLAKLSPLAEGRNPRPSALAYVCRNFACDLPARTPKELEAQLGGARS